MMLHQDGSRHGWLPGREAMDLIVTMDDATSTIHSAFLTPEEATGSTVRALPVAPASCQSPGEGSAIPRWHARDLPRAALAGPL